MGKLEEQMAALSEQDLNRLCDILTLAESKMKGGYSYASEIYSLEYEFPFSDADVLDSEGLMHLAKQETARREEKAAK